MDYQLETEKLKINDQSIFSNIITNKPEFTDPVNTRLSESNPLPIKDPCSFVASRVKREKADNDPHKAMHCIVTSEVLLCTCCLACSSSCSNLISFKRLDSNC